MHKAMRTGSLAVRCHVAPVAQLNPAGGGGSGGGSEISTYGDDMTNADIFGEWNDDDIEI